MRNIAIFPTLLGLLIAGCSARAPGPYTAAGPTATPTVPPSERRGAPVYEGCFIAFDRPTPTAPPQGEGAEPGVVSLSIVLDAQSEGGFEALELSLLDCAGAGHGPIRDVGWRRVTLEEEWYTRAPRLELDGAPITVASGALPSGEYLRVFAAVEAAVGIDGQGTRVALNTHVEPITRPFTLPPGGTQHLTIVLTVQPRPSFLGGGWNLFVREAAIAPVR